MTVSFSITMAVSAKAGSVLSNSIIFQRGGSAGMVAMSRGQSYIKTVT